MRKRLVLFAHLSLFYQTLFLISSIYFSKQALDPECLKIAQVTPAHKQNDTHFCSYYRLKSLLPVFGKLFEKTMYEQGLFL